MCSLLTTTGLNILFSGGINGFEPSNDAYDVLIPPLVETLTTVEAPYPYPPDPKVYEGVYTTGIPGQPNATIITYKNQLLLSGSFNVFLAYREPLNLQVHLSVYKSYVCLSVPIMEVQQKRPCMHA